MVQPITVNAIINIIPLLTSWSSSSPSMPSSTSSLCSPRGPTRSPSRRASVQTHPDGRSRSRQQRWDEPGKQNNLRARKMRYFNRCLNFFETFLFLSSIPCPASSCFYQLPSYLLLVRLYVSEGICAYIY